MRALAAWGAALLLAGPAAAAERVLSFDQCADQYVLAMAPRATIVGLSRRARNADSYLRAKAVGLPLRRATPEQALGVRPTVVVRYWGGDPRLLADLRNRGVRVLTIDDATDFTGVAKDIRTVAAGLGQAVAGERLVNRMNAELAAAAGAGKGRGALYLTSGGDTTGSGTLIDAMLRAAGFSNLRTRPGYGAVNLEQLVLNPPDLVVQGFYDQNMAAYERWSIGRSAVLRRLIADRATVSLPGSLLGCPAWFAADGAAALAAWARRGS